MLSVIRGRWSAGLYNEETWNCFTFVLEFLTRLKHYPLSNRAKNKVEFVKQYVVPKTSQAGKYISLYRKLRSASQQSIPISLTDKSDDEIK